MKTFLAIVIGISLVLFIWGLIGSSMAAEIGNTCDIGLGKDGSVFCWKWHQNTMGDIQEGINEFLNK